MSPDEIERRLSEHENRLWKVETKAYAIETHVWLTILAIVLVGIILAILLASGKAAQGAEAAAPTLPCLLSAIRQVESAGPGDHDGGRALPPYEIHRDYWTDSGVPGRYEDCLREPYARRVVLAYMRRHEPAALARVDAEALARLHNGGPSWRARASTLAYWRKVRRALEAP